MDIISASGISAFLENELKSKVEIDVRKSVESTNSEVKALAVAGVEEGYILISEEQSHGRGRLGRSFFSPSGNGIYMSLLLRPVCSAQEATLITSAAAVAVCEALGICGVEHAKIKWVNDVYIGDKKVCGILTEAGFGAGGCALDYAVLGVGINVYAPDGGFPDELKSIAGFVFDGRVQSLRNRLAACFINSFFKYYKKLSEREHVPVYREKCFVLGENIVIHSGENRVNAKALDIDENCNLLVEYENGKKGMVGSGEISVRLK
jgi:BirA family biotin operon repressor/biotin-[acetyl-CoA-carboxylase] ligase